MRYFVLALLMFVAGAALTRLERETVEFRPLARMRTTTGLFVTLVMRQPVKRSVCAETLATLERALTASCPACTIESTECAQNFEGIENALVRNEPLPIYTVDSDAFRVAMVGPTEAVIKECNEMASEIGRRGSRTAVCHAPSVVSARQ